MFKLGLIINPFAGIGGALALKGSDGKEIRQQALAAGAVKKANDKTRLALNELAELKDSIKIYCAAGEMGSDLVSAMGFNFQSIYQPTNVQTEPEDTMSAARAMLDADVDFILFAGGDGTARNICDIVEDAVPVLGIPAGCKIHSGVYAVTPVSAGRVVRMLAGGEMVSVDSAEVKDIDEQAFRQGRVSAKLYGEMRVPSELRYVQAVKMGGKESEELVLADIAAHVIEDMEDNPDTYYVMGSGSTVAAIMQELGLENTLLGVDLVKGCELIDSDLTAQQLLTEIQGKDSRLVITLIGGQGHIFGRGNQQLSADVIQAVGRQNLMVVATKQKLQALEGRPLIVDTANPALDRKLSGSLPVLTGYRDQVLYPIMNPEFDHE